MRRKDEKLAAKVDASLAGAASARWTASRPERPTRAPGRRPRPDPRAPTPESRSSPRQQGPRCCARRGPCCARSWPSSRTGSRGACGSVPHTRASSTRRQKRRPAVAERPRLAGRAQDPAAGSEGPLGTGGRLRVVDVVRQARVACPHDDSPASRCVSPDSMPQGWGEVARPAHHRETSQFAPRGLVASAPWRN